MTARARLAAVLPALLLAGCSDGRDPLPAACTGEPAELLTALRQAPGQVVLADGTALSDCVQRARGEGDLQALGIVYLRVADTLRGPARSDPAAALRLGYLAGAVAAGAARTEGGLAAQLARRVEQSSALEPGSSAAAEAALRRGREAGEARG